MQFAFAHKAATVAVVAVLVSCASIKPVDALTEEVENAHRNLAKAYSACDEPAFTEAYAENFSFITSNTRLTIKTKDGLRAYLGGGCRLTPNPTAAITTQSVRFVGTQAVVTGQYLFRVPAGAKVADVPQNFTALFIREAGSWRVVAHHVSLVP